MLLDTLPAGCAEGGGQSRFGDELFHRRAERFDVPGGHEDASAPAEHLPDPADIGRDTRQAGCHGLKERERQVLIQ